MTTVLVTLLVVGFVAWVAAGGFFSRSASTKMALASGVVTTFLLETGTWIGFVIGFVTTCIYAALAFSAGEN